MALVISPRVREKIANKNPPVTGAEIRQCFGNRLGKYLYDEREDNRTDPPTKWFIAETDFGRNLKVVFIQRDGDVFIRTAYKPNREEIRIYKKFTRQL